MRAIILANLEPTGTGDRGLKIDGGDLVIAADGGAHHCRTLGIRPDALIGDFDSLSAEELAVWERSGVDIIRHPRRKDATDLELALRLARERGATRIDIHGALGGRWDMSAAALMFPASREFRGLDVRLIDGNQEIRALEGPGVMEISGRPGDTVSLIPLSDPAAGVTLSGLEYPLDQAVLPLGSTWGVSNVLTGKKASVRLESGLLLICRIQGGPDEMNHR